ncbi:MAG: hypothetical protein JXX14_00485, partial [Deltaproteobacteria bacterium]|nr:hypothetical protein [Deltaproteobacteria bacterium]
HIYELCCPECRAELVGVPGDRIFVCRSCTGVFAVGNGRLTRQSLYVARPVVAPDGDQLYLPFWRFRVLVCVLDQSGRDVTASTQGSALDYIWVPAFHDVRPNVFGNPGLSLSLARPAPEATLWPADTPLKLPGAARRSDEAAIYVQPLVAGIVDRQKDISGLRIDAQVLASEYWAVPFSVDGARTRLRDLLSGDVFPVNVVEQLNEILLF